MFGKAYAPIFALAFVAGCLGANAPVVPGSSDTSQGPYDPLTEDQFAMGAFLSASVEAHDGAPLHVDIQLPAGEGPFPTILEFTPYSSTLNPTTEAWGALRGLGQDASHALAGEYVPKGYAVAVAHVRGSGQSGGCFDVGGPNDGLDGYALVEWLAAQEWSNGRVAMMGTSYVGTTPIATAIHDPPHLTTIIPVSAVSEWYRYYFENGEPRVFGELPVGVVYFDHPIWAATGLIPKPRAPTASDPIANAGCGLAQMQQAWEQDDYNDYWMARNYVKDIANATAPMLYAHGFLDENTPTSLVTDFYPAYPGVKRLWMQQHGHGVPDSFESYHTYVHAWLDHFLLDRNTGVLDLAPVVLQDSRGKYHEVADWPPKNVSWQLLHMGEGTLSTDVPPGGTLSYMDEPRSMDEFVGPRDGAFLQFDTAPLTTAMQITGAPRIELVAASDQPDTQWDVLLYDVDPAGSAAFITRGYLDARHGGSLARGIDVTPGQERLYAWNMHGRDHYVDAGHTIRLVVVSTEEYVLPDTPGATNTIRLGADGSRLLLPLLAAGAYEDAAPVVVGRT